jgi:hypothetical protein
VPAQRLQKNPRAPCRAISRSSREPSRLDGPRHAADLFMITSTIVPAPMR